MAPVRDPNTLSNHLVFQTTHTDVALALSFATSSLAGEVTLTMKAAEDTLEDIVLDTSYLSVEAVKVDGKVAKWSLAERMEPYGSALTVDVGREVKRGEAVKVKVCSSQGPWRDQFRYPTLTPVADQLRHDRQVHCAPVDDAWANLQQETPLYV